MGILLRTARSGVEAEAHQPSFFARVTRSRDGELTPVPDLADRSARPRRSGGSSSKSARIGPEIALACPPLPPLLPGVLTMRSAALHFLLPTLVKSQDRFALPAGRGLVGRT